ncbi:MAG: TetR family transcriptional regulator [Saprospiraceae bacterium]|nr:TetR family transcriptional regulator [Saprospiraceae bacterium]
MSPTKQRIIEAAIDLYNNHGVSAVTMRDIAARISISSGNLAYHFKNQDFIIAEVFKQMENERDQILSGVQEIPSFENINRQLIPILQIARRYAFLYLDSVYIFRAYPSIAQLQRAYFEQSIAYVKAVIDISVGAGTFQPEPRPGAYQRLAHSAWMIINFWLEQGILRGTTNEPDQNIQQHIWDLVIPHLTEKGQHQLSKLYKNENATT